MDWTITMIAAFSFMVHFGLVGGMFSDWMDPIVADEANITGLVDLASSLPAPRVESEPLENPSAPTQAVAPEAKPAAPSGEKPATHKGAAPGPKTSADQAKLMGERADALELSVLGLFGGSSAVQGALD